MKIVNVGENEFQCLVEGERYRVTTVTRIVGVDEESIKVTNEPIKYGLNVEKKISEDQYYVIVTLKWNDYYEKVDIDLLDDDGIQSLRNLIEEIKDPAEVVKYLEEYLNCVDFAKQTLMDIYGDSTCVS